MKITRQCSWLAIGVVWCAGACQDAQRVTRPDDSGINKQYVAGAAAAALNPKGHFVIPATTSGWSRAELSETDAAAIAGIWVRQFSPTNPQWYEEAHGSKIDFASLHRCGRAFYALSPYIEPGKEFNPSELNAVASKWLLTYCDASEIPSVSVAVATTATYVRITNGRIDGRSLRGMEIFACGIPAGSTIPISPERAVEGLSRASGKRIMTVPRLIIPGSWHGQGAQWMLETEAPVEVQSVSGKRGTDRTFYVGIKVGGGWEVRTHRGVSTTNSPFFRDTLYRLSGQAVGLARRADVPRALEVVDVIGGRP
jgi:hypothetical protein